MSRHAAAFALLCLLAMLPSVAADRGPAAGAIEAFLDSPPADLEDTRDHALLSRHLRRLYADRDHLPLWFDSRGLTDRARDALEHLGQADEHGLRPGDYLIGPIDPEIIGRFRADSPAEVIALTDLALSFSALRYIKDLHEGRFSPEQLDLDLDISHRKLDLAAELLAVMAADDPAAAVDARAPIHRGYWLLKDELARYRELARADEWTPLDDGAVVRPGDGYRGLDALRRRLTLTGDLPADSPGSTGVYDGDVVEAVKRFQLRHGLDDDGIMGKQTFAQLNVSWEDRIAQIVVGLERWRWLPEASDGTPIVVNVPSYVMRGLDQDGDRFEPGFESRVVVGKTYHRYQTPIFSGRIRYLDFRPYWNIPRSIVKNEMVSKLSASWLEKNDYEIVRAFGHDAKPLAPTAENLAAVKAGRLQVRQRPGPNNALGLVKFIFPNEHNVYLHSTPAKSLFGKSRRAFSHGCIRVAEPVGLAEWVLGDQPEWDRPAIERAMNEGGPTRVQVSRSIPVYILYSTALVDRSTGLLHFWDDIYGGDAKLAAALGHPLSETVRERWTAIQR